MFKRLVILGLLLTLPAWSEDHPCTICSVEQSRVHLEACDLSAEWEGTTHYFCQSGCQKRFAEDPAGWAQKFQALTDQAVSSGALPSFKFPLEPIGSLSSTDLEGRVAVINFWATWCQPCMEEMPDLIKLQKEYGDRGLSVIGISFDKDRASHRQGLQRLGLNFPSVFADQESVQTFLKHLGPMPAIPVTLVVDAKGKIVKRIEGKSNFKDLRRVVEPLLAPSKKKRRSGSVAPS